MRSRPLVMRIITRLAGGGPPLHVTLLHEQIQDRGYESLLVFGSCQQGEQDVEHLLSSAAKIVRIPQLGRAPALWDDLIALFKLWRLMLHYRPDIVHTHTAKAGLLGRLAALLAGCPCIVHTFHGHVLEGYFSRSVNVLLRWTERALGMGSRALVTVSQQQAEELSTRFGVAKAEKFHVVSLGTDLSPFQALPDPDWTRPRLTVLWLGRFVPIKNLPLLLRVAKLAQARDLNLQFLLAGEGPLKDELQSMAKQFQLQNVEFLPWHQDVTPLLERSHFLLMTSLREGTPLSLIQGMAAGRPFVSTPAGGTVDLGAGLPRLDKDTWWYENGVIVRAEESALLDCLLRISRDRLLGQRMGRTARDFALSRFQGQRLVADIVQLYDELLSSKGQGKSSFAEVNS
ncbi:MAG: glycosyltransferase [Bryobacter sp.]|nr:glycosyltransferase [Bryobacter sp.]